MADVQLHFAIGIPSLAVLIGFITNVVQLNAMNTRLGSFRTAAGRTIQLHGRQVRTRTGFEI
jgi:hypothetical protein